MTSRTFPASDAERRQSAQRKRRRSLRIAALACAAVSPLMLIRSEAADPLLPPLRAPRLLNEAANSPAPPEPDDAQPPENRELSPDDYALHAAPSPSRTEPLTFDLARRGVATREDAYRVFVRLAVEHGRLVADPSPECLSFEQLRAGLQQICVVPGTWSGCPDDCLRRETLALLTANYLDIKPGLLTRVFGPTERYAYRELVFRGLIAPGNPRSTVSGSELLSVMTRVAALCPEHVELTPDEIH